MTRPAPSAEAFVQSLPALLRDKLDVLISPLVKIRATNARIDMTGIRGVIVTSANGVVHGPPPINCPVFCVGERTTQVAREQGWAAQIAGQCADQLIDTISKMHPDTPLLHICGTFQRGDIAARLTDLGLPTRTLAVYDQALLPLTQKAKAALAAGGSCIVPLFSPRTAAQFVAECDDLRNVTVLALSEAVAEAAMTKRPKHLLVADQPTAVSMRLALETLM